MVHALAAGTIVAVLAALVGWFMVLRHQSFAGHTLALVGFPGAAGAALLGISVSYGYFGGAILAALAIALLPGGGGRRRGEESAVTGTVQAFVLACGFLFVALYPGFLERAQRSALRELSGDQSERRSSCFSGRPLVVLVASQLFWVGPSSLRASTPKRLRLGGPGEGALGPRSCCF